MNSKPTSPPPEQRRAIERVATTLLLDHAEAIVILADADQRIVLASASLVRLTGRDWHGADIAELLVDFRGTPDLAAMRGEEHDGQILHFPTSDGSPASCRARVRGIEDQYLLFAETTEADIRQLRQEMLRLNVELHDLGRELQRRNAQLDRIVKTKDEFVGMAAHDLRNPLGVIMSFSEILLEGAAGPLTDDQREFLDVMHGSSQFMLALINNLLSYTAIESGRLQLDRTPTDLGALVRRNLSRNRFLGVPKNIDIGVEIDDDLPLLSVDPHKCEQVLNNLISNAVKFSEPGRGILVRCRREDAHVVLEVEDHGQGIPEAELPSLFTPFARTSVRATRGEGSTGLGLAIVKRIVEGHGASIDVRSRVGEGTTVAVRLPRALWVDA